MNDGGGEGIVVMVVEGGGHGDGVGGGGHGDGGGVSGLQC